MGKESSLLTVMINDPSLIGRRRTTRHRIMIGDTKHAVAVLSYPRSRDSLEGCRHQRVPLVLRETDCVYVQSGCNCLPNALQTTIQGLKKEYPCAPLISHPLNTSDSRFRSFSICSGDEGGMLANSSRLIGMAMILSRMDCNAHEYFPLPEERQCSEMCRSNSARTRHEMR